MAFHHLRQRFDDADRLLWSLESCSSVSNEVNRQRQYGQFEIAVIGMAFRTARDNGYDADRLLWSLEAAPAHVK